MTQVLFDKLTYMDRLTRAGVDESQARAHAEAMEEALRDSVATKSDVLMLKNEIAAPPWRRLRDQKKRNVAYILEDIEYLVPLISYLGSNPVWWARSAPSLAGELALDTGRVQQIFERYPMIFRKSRYQDDEKACAYALQMRYAQRKDTKINEPPKISAFPTLTESQVITLIEFLVKVSTLETGVRSATRSAYVAIAAAVLSAVTAIVVAVLAAMLKVLSTG
jgi:hypothetical protein